MGRYQTEGVFLGNVLEYTLYDSINELILIGQL